MTLQELSEKILSSPRGEALRKALGSRTRIISVYNLAGSAPAMMLGAMPARKAPTVVVADSLDDAGYIYHDLTRIIGEEKVAMFPSGYKRDIKYGQVDPPSQILRTEALNRWHLDSAPQYVVTYPEALAEKVASRRTIDEHTIHLVSGGEYDLTDIIKWLRGNGFSEVDYVYEPGQFASRGSILDIFGYSNELPLRIDFFGDEIDSIRLFNIETQLSEQKLNEVSITSGIASESSSGGSLLDYIDSSTLFVVRDADYTVSRIRAIAGEDFSQSALIAGEGDSAAMNQVVDADEFSRQFAGFRQLRFTSGARPDTEAGASIDFGCSPQIIYHKNFDLIADSFTQFINDGYTIYILSDSEKQIERLNAIFADRGNSTISFSPVLPTLHEGFSDKGLRMCVFTDHQIFDRFHKYTLKSDRARSGKLALSLKELSAIEPGDYIVHVDHGVGRFAGLLRTNVNGRTQEMIKLVYANDDIIFVSIHALHKLAKYRGKEGVPPKINKLGTGAWNKLKERTKSKLKDIARDLIRLYAARKEEQGHAFAPDSYLQQELEASFIYEDTPDQLTATRAVKADMESPKPMDRLICGDVGFGKTEVATSRIQGCGRRQADRSARPHNRTCLSAFPDILRTAQGTACASGLPVTRTHSQTGQRDSKQSRRRKDRYTDRHPQDNRQGGAVQRSRAPYYRRGAEIWRCRKRETQAAKDKCRHPHHECDTDSTHSTILPDGCPRPIIHQHPSSQPVSDHHLGQRRERRHHKRGCQLRAVTQRTGVHSQQPHRRALRSRSTGETPRA